VWGEMHGRDVVGLSTGKAASMDRFVRDLGICCTVLETVVMILAMASCSYRERNRAWTRSEMYWSRKGGLSRSSGLWWIRIDCLIQEIMNK
jgi:hypothetical protein